MAESTVRLLIADAATLPKASGTGIHHHAFWQLDHCAGGGFDALLPTGAVRLRRGEGALIPPGVRHGFAYPRGASYVSWKFTWDGPAAASAIVLLRRQPGWAGIAAALAARPAPAAIPHLLTAALRLVEAPPAAEPGLAEAVARLVDAHPARAWSVAAVARGLRLTPGHASARFRAERGMALKTWLDARRAEHVARLLRGSDLLIGDVAAVCGFADQFALSRFFRRVSGESPSAFRAREPVTSSAPPP